MSIILTRITVTVKTRENILEQINKKSRHKDGIKYVDVGIIVRPLLGYQFPGQVLIINFKYVSTNFVDEYITAG